MYLSHSSQQGMSLVTVMLLSSLAGILVLGSLRDNIIQERLSGNFQKKMNAQLVAERGIFETHAALLASLQDNPDATLEELMAAVGGDSLARSGNGGLSDMRYSVDLSKDASGQLLLASRGKRFEGSSALKARFELTSGGGSSPFANAIVGCEGVNITGSAKIDSFNSNTGSYDPNLPGENANVTTIEEDADVTLAGHSPIFGDVAATGNIVLGGSSPVEGSLHANGDITLGQSRVSGSVLARGNYSQAGGSVGGYVRAIGDVFMNWGASILNPNNTEPDILYGGAAEFKDNWNQKNQAGTLYSSGLFRVMPEIEKVPESNGSAPDPSDPTNSDGVVCDTMGITDEIAAVDDGLSTLASIEVGPNKGFDLSTRLGRFYRGSGPSSTPKSAIFLGNVQDVYKVSRFAMTSNAKVKISGGDVFMYVEGDFRVGGDTEMIIEEDSSLTLLIKGKVILGNGARIIAEKPGLTSESKRPSMSIYSSNADETGVEVSGDLAFYAAVYAPFTEVKISGSGELYGSVRGKTVSVPGGSAIHYDHALANIDPPGGLAGKKKLRLVGWEY